MAARAPRRHNIGGLPALARPRGAPEAALLAAIAKNDVKGIRAAIRDRGAIVTLHLVEEEDATPLHIACARQACRTVQCLLAHGADASATDVRGRTPLHFACRDGEVGSVGALLLAPATDIDAADDHGMTAVKWACIADSVPKLRLLRHARELNDRAEINKLIEPLRQRPATESYLRSRLQRAPQPQLPPAPHRGASPRGRRARSAGGGPRRACCICLESQAAPAGKRAPGGRGRRSSGDSGSSGSDGGGVDLVVSCAGGSHHLCARCLEGHVAAEVAEGRRRLAAGGGGVRCPAGAACASFDAHTLARHLPREAYAAYLDAWQGGVEARATQTAEAAARRAVAARAAMDPVAAARAHVVEAILTPACPRCGKAFVDFDGCFALRCDDAAGNGCGAHFCGYCLAACGDGGAAAAHAHVARCRYNLAPGHDLFGPLELFERARALRASRLTESYLRTLRGSLRSRVRAAIAQDLRDLGVGLEEPKAGDDGGGAQPAAVAPAAAAVAPAAPAAPAAAAELAAAAAAEPAAAAPAPAAAAAAPAAAAALGPAAT